MKSASRPRRSTKASPEGELWQLRLYVAGHSSRSAAALANLKTPPDIVVCDSQMVLKMVADTPPAVPCTTFSILFARLKGDLPRLDLDLEAAWQLGHGQALWLPRLQVGRQHRAYGPDGRFLGVAQVNEDGKLAPKRLVAGS